METIEVGRLNAALAKATTDRKCVQAWIGYGSNLFIGFGDIVIPKSENNKHPKPPFEIHSRFATWLVEAGDRVITSEMKLDPKILATDVDNLLVGRDIIRYRFDGNHASLTVDFDGDIVLRIAPYPEREHRRNTAWDLCNNGLDYVTVFCDGIAIVHDAKERGYYPDNPNQFEKLLNMIDRLDDASVHYWLDTPTPHVLVVNTIISDERWDIVYTMDGNVRVSAFEHVEMADPARRLTEKIGEREARRAQLRRRFEDGTA